jgi:excinuclease ABC subunit C
MTSQEFKERADTLPEEPGVYFFKGSAGQILYIGKATSLRDRVRSYFAADVIKTRGRRIVDMVALAIDLDFTKTDSVLEALILEANLIKYHQPKYNTDEKDNKSYNYVVFTNEAFPKILTVRGRILLTETQAKKYKYIFGPFPHGAQLKEALKIIRRIFPYSDNKCVPAEEQIAAGKAPRPCFNRQIGLCPGVCTGEVSEAEYAERIQNLRLFFEGKKKMLLKNLEKQMNAFAKKQEFEQAGEVRRTVFALTHIQDIALLKQENRIDESAGGEFAQSSGENIMRIEAYDVAHSSGKNVVGVMVVIEDGEVKKSDYRKFKIKLNPGVNDTAALKEILRRRLGHMEWNLPSLIVVDGAQAQINAAEAVLKERKFSIPVISVVKDSHHKPRGIMGESVPESSDMNSSINRAVLLANSEAHRFAVTYHRKKRDRIV